MVGMLRRWWLETRNAWIYWTKRRHRGNIQQARRILRTLRTFEHDGQIMMYLKKIDPYVFEELVIQLFDESGFAVWRTPSYSGDGGMDGKVYHPSLGWCFIQSKRYNKSIRSEHVHTFVKLVGKRHGFFVHSGTSSNVIRQDLAGTRIRMLSGSTLVDFIREPQCIYKKLGVSN